MIIHSVIIASLAILLVFTYHYIYIYIYIYILYNLIGVLGCCVWAHGYGLIAVLEYKLSSIRQVTTYRQHSTLTAGSKCHTLETTQLVGKCCGGVRREMGSAELLAR